MLFKETSCCLCWFATVNVSVKKNENLRKSFQSRAARYILNASVSKAVIKEDKY